MHFRMLLWCLAIQGYGVCALADEAAVNPKAFDLTQIIAQMSGGSPPGAAEPEKESPPFEEVTKGMEAKKGLFTLWAYPEGAKDKDPEKLLCQIPASFLGEKFMLSTSFSGGGFFTGFPLDERVVKWQELGRQLLLIQPETRYVADGDHTVNDVVRRTYPDRIRTAVPIITKSPSGDPVIDLGPLLKSDFADIGWMSFGGGGINPTLSKWIDHKPFEDNVEIGVELAVANMYPPGSFEKKLVHYSFWRLKQSDYAPRVADDRVGYFLTTNQDWAKPTDARDIFNRYVDRWHLVKRDPSLALCEPKDPIIFYIEKTVPVRFRRAVRDGILEWNKAYEKVGFLNAVEVRQQTDDNEWKDLDPEDMRYSFFRWIVTGAGFAMGPHRANPFTGQIYDADIIFDDSMVRYFEQSAQQQLPSTALAMKLNDPAWQSFLEQFPQWKRPQQDWEEFVFGEGKETKLREAMRRRARERGQHCCEYTEGMRHQMAVAGAVLAGQPKEVIDKLLYDVIKEVVMHEVGHTLGLRHNFRASSIYSLEEIQKRRTTAEATVGSVMDYNPVLFFKEKATEGHFITPTIGPYDYWAVEYGYRPFDESYADKKKDEAGEEKKEKEKDAPKTETKTAAPEAPAEVKVAVSMDAIPKEAFEQMPPEVREQIKKLMKSGAAAATMESGAAPAAPKESGPSFRAAPSGEEGMLREIASRAAEPELTYATDEDTMFASPDPRTNRFDMGADPVEWARTRIDLVNQRMDNLLDWAVKDQESWYHVRDAFVSLLIEKVFVLDYVGRYIGGQYFNRCHRGDANAPPPFELVDPKLQRSSLAFIEENLFSDQFFTFPPQLLNHLAPPRWWHEGMSISFTLDFPIHRYIGLLQWRQLIDRLEPNILRRLYDAEMKTTASDKFTVAEYIQRMQKACWGDACDAERAKKGTWTDAAPFVSSIRRSLQREYLGLMEPLVRTPPGRALSPDLHALIKYSLQKLSTDLDNVLKCGKALDFASEAHLTGCKTRIDRMLAPELKEYEARMSSLGSF
ncbi:MAG: zinc-dependent metalloprotease [Planctomycetota bacterium]